MDMFRSKPLRGALALVASAIATTLVLLGVNMMMSGSSSAEQVDPTGEVKGYPASVAVSESVSPAGTPTPAASPVPQEPQTKIVTMKVTFDPNGNDVQTVKSGKVAVGVLPALRFKKDVPQDKRAELAGNFPVVTAADQTPVAGSWAWTGEQTLQFRPEKFWKGKTEYQVLVTDPEMVLEVSEGKTLVLGAPVDGWRFLTARSFVGYIDAKKTRMNIYVDGKKVKTFPVSLGKSGWETRSGIKVFSGEKLASKVYTSESLGLTTETYRLTAPWNLRLTPSGEFIHGAPWAYGRIGRFNGSHGCTNMFAKDAEWVFDNAMPGDVFVYRGTSKGMEPWNGPGGLWNVSDKAWRKAASTPLQ